VKDGKFREAIAAYTEAQKLDPTLEISADSWHSLCWDGSVHGYAKDVMSACEKAVALEPESGIYRSNRGIARALIGNNDGAIKDFYASVQWSNSAEARAKYSKVYLDPWRSKRQSWIAVLKAGKNPFTPEEIKSLLK
jgi:tetratricopeptide (TPR) repeat protein